MMILAAIVLLIAFVSLAVMVARVTLVANETTRDSHGSFLRESEAVASAVEMIRDQTSDYDEFLGYTEDLQAFEARRGFLLSWECNDDTNDFFRLTDGRSTITIALPGPENPAGEGVNENDCVPY